MSNNKVAVPEEIIMDKIYLIRNQKIMLDRDLAALYGVLTGNLNKAVKRNIKCFPEDFMFRLTKEEFDDLKFQFGTSSWGGARNFSTQPTRPYLQFGNLYILASDSIL